MILCASVGLVLTIVSVINGMVCTSNFNKGLKPLLLSQSGKHVPLEESEGEDPWMSPALGTLAGSQSGRQSRRFDIE